MAHCRGVQRVILSLCSDAVGCKLSSIIQLPPCIHNLVLLLEVATEAA